jgi:hypothetical protein
MRLAVACALTEEAGQLDEELRFGKLQANRWVMKQ